MPKSISTPNIDEVRAYTSAAKAKENNGNFRFFRYSQNYLSDSDFGNQNGKDIKITGIQLQTLALCLRDFFDFSDDKLSYNGALNENTTGISNSQYKNSPISKTISDIQSGRTSNVPNDENLKIQIIKRYNKSFAKGKDNQYLKSSDITLEKNTPEQLGVIGPVTYNFIIRQAIFQWFKKTYLALDSFLSKTLPILDEGWSTKEIPSEQGYYIYVSSAGNPNDNPYPTIGVLFDVEQNITDKEAIEKARQYIDFLLSRDTTALQTQNGFFVKTTKKDNGLIRICVYADFAEVLYCKMDSINYSVIDMIKAGVSLINKANKEFYGGKNNDTIQIIKNSVQYPTNKYLDLQTFIDSTKFEFKTPDSILKNAQLFYIANQSTQDYSDPDGYSITTIDLLTSHLKNINEIADRITSERNIKKNILFRNYPSSPIDENIKLYYDAEYNLLAATVLKKPKATTEPTKFDDTKCITVNNNSNLTIVNIDVQASTESLLDVDAVDAKYKTLAKDEAIVFITEFFVRQFYDVYDSIKKDISSAAGTEKSKNILEKSKMFISSKDFSKLKVDYLYVYDKNTLLEKAIDEKATLQFVKLKTSNYWTKVQENIAGIPEGNLDNFISFHYPEIIHKPSAKKPDPPTKISGTPVQPPQSQRIETLKTNNGFIVIPNDISLDTKLKVTDILADDCFGGIISRILSGQKFGGEKAINAVFTVLKYLDIPYLISLVADEITKKLNELINALSDQTTKSSVQSSVQQFNECFPPAQPKVININGKKDLDFADIAGILGLVALYNIPKIPSLKVADIWKTIKKAIFEFVIQLILELIVQFVNFVIKKIKDSICKITIDTTAGAANDKKPNKLAPRLPPGVPQPETEEPKCTYDELLSTSPNISKLQIFNTLRQFYKIDISNNDFDSFFGGLSSLLTTQQIINTLSNSIDEDLYAIIKKYSKNYSKIENVFFNISTTSSFFNFISKYVDLTPCYEQLLKDNRNPNYCFDDMQLPENLSDQEILDKSNDLLSQLSSLCELLNQEALADKISNIPVLDDPIAKDAIASGAKATIEMMHKNFLQLSSRYLASYDNIDKFNFYIKSLGKETSVFNINKDTQINQADAIITKLIEYKSGIINSSPITTRYKYSQIKDESADQVIKISFISSEQDKPKNQRVVNSAFEQASKQFYEKLSIPENLPSYDNPPETVTFTKNIEKINITFKPENIISWADSTPALKQGSETKTNFVIKAPEFSLEKDLNVFKNIFFNDDRFSQKIAKDNKTLARQIKNYYYVYDNLSNQKSKDTNKNVNNLKKYVELEKELEAQLKNTVI